MMAAGKNATSPTQPEQHTGAGQPHGRNPPSTAPGCASAVNWLLTWGFWGFWLLGATVLLLLTKWWVLPLALPVGILAARVAWDWAVAGEKKAVQPMTSVAPPAKDADSDLVGPNRSDRLLIVHLVTWIWWGLAVALTWAMRACGAAGSQSSRGTERSWSAVVPIVLVFLAVFVRFVLETLDWRATRRDGTGTNEPQRPTP
jgi:hypothetical protein